MAKIRNANPKNSSGGYVRLVMNEQLAMLFTKVQSTVITNGTELEKIISKIPNIITDLDQFIEEAKRNHSQTGAFLCTKKVLKASQYRAEKYEPDFLVFVIDQDNKKVCNIIELKDGDAFDTKKSSSELEGLQHFTNHIAPKIPCEVRVTIYLTDLKNNKRSPI